MNASSKKHNKKLQKNTSNSLQNLQKNITKI